MIKIGAAIKCLKLAESRIDEPRCIEQFVLSARALMSDVLFFLWFFFFGVFGVCVCFVCFFLFCFFFSIEMLFKCLRRSGYRCLAQPSISAIPETTPSLPQAAVRHRAPYAPLR